LKTGTVMFGEALDPVTLERAVNAAEQCDVFVAAGTSLQVRPAASLVGIAIESGARLVIVNAEPTPYDPLADEVIRGPISEVLPQVTDRLRTV
jgi:NAD-dependent deacetylase